MAASPLRQNQPERPHPDRTVRPSPSGPRLSRVEASSVAQPGPVEPRWTDALWVTLVCGALRPFSWLMRCRRCWRGRFHAEIGELENHLVAVHVCSVCDATKPLPRWLQPPSHRKNIRRRL